MCFPKCQTILQTARYLSNLKSVLIWYQTLFQEDAVEVICCHLLLPNAHQHSIVSGWFVSELGWTWRSAQFQSHSGMLLAGVCKHSVQPSSTAHLKAIGTCVPGSYRVWLITSWVTSLCWESGGGQARGVSVRGQGSNQSRTLLTPCADIQESAPTIEHGFLSNLLIFLIISISKRTKSCFSFLFNKELWKRGKEAIGKLSGCSPLSGTQCWGRLDAPRAARNKSGLEPHQDKWTCERTNVNTGKERTATWKFNVIYFILK